MKRYLYSLLSALLLFAVGCELPGTDNPKPNVCFCFGEVVVDTTDTSAVVDILAYITVDDVKYEGTTLSVEYWAGGDSANMKSIAEYTETSDGRVAFTLTDLMPNTRYYANIVCDGGKKYGVERREFTFATKVALESDITCDAEVSAKGLMATINLTNLSYVVNDVAQQIAFVKVEYTPKGQQAWTAVEVAGSSVKNKRVSIAIPKSGDSYLVENSTYLFRVTITPADSDFMALTTDNFEFKTTYAKITADIAKPKMTLGDEGITIEMGSIAVYYDGVESEEYTKHLYFRARSSSIWEEYAVDENMSVTIPMEQLEASTIYESKVCIVAGAMSSVCESNVASLSIPMSDTPVVPEPPIGGDTSSIAGVWHLTSWRGATPSFEVYLDITATGGVTLYQCIENRYWDVYQSSAAIENGVIYGVYTDDVAWSTSYNLSISGDTMTWVSTADSTDVSVYTRSSLPSYMPTAPTRAAEASERFL